MPRGSMSAASVKLRAGDETRETREQRRQLPGHIKINGSGHSVYKHVRVRVTARRSRVADGRNDHWRKQAGGGYGGDHVTISPSVEVDDDVGTL